MHSKYNNTKHKHAKSIGTNIYRILGDSVDNVLRNYDVYTNPTEELVFIYSHNQFRYTNSRTTHYLDFSTNNYFANFQ